MLVAISMTLGAMLLAFLFFILLFAAAVFAGGLPLTSVVFWLAVLAAGATGFIVSRWQFGPEKAGPAFRRLVVLAVLLVMGCLYVSGLFYDISYDGQVYHQEAVQKLVHNWNPFWEYLLKSQSHSAVLLNHYAKGPWLCAAGLYTATYDMEQSKAANLILLCAAGLLTLGTLAGSRLLSRRQAVLLTVLMTLNPVSIYQSLSFYLDGQLAALLLCLLALCWRAAGKADQTVWLCLGMTLALLVNVKFTGVVYAVLSLGLVAAWLLYKKQPWRRLVMTAALGLSLGLGVIGYNPYVTNTLYYGHPFYPLYGAGAQTMDIMTANSPQGFLQLSSAEKLYMATFSFSTNKFDTEGPVLKLPFYCAPEELRPFVYGADVRIGGFGPWFGGIVLLSVIVLGMLWRLKAPRRRQVSLLIAGVMITVLINPEAWWARYVPQLWLVPLLLAGAALTAELKALTYAGRALAVAAAVNILLVSYPYFVGNYYCSLAVEQEMNKLAALEQPVSICFGDFTSNYERFARWGIAYIDEGDDVADMNIEDIRYRYLTAAGKQPLLAGIFTEEGEEKHEGDAP